MFYFYNRPPRVVERELNECKNYMESMEKHSGAFEEICVAYHEKKKKYEQIAEDIRLLEKELAVCRNVNQQHNPGCVSNVMPVTS
jgi:hypothetical protein